MSVAAPGLWSFPLDDGLVLVRPGDQRLRVLNASARLLWEGRQAGLDSLALAGRLMAVYGIPRVRAEADIGAILALWREAGLLDGAPPGSPPPALQSVPGPTLRAARPGHFPVVADYGFYRVPFRIRWGDEALAAATQPLLAPLADQPHAQAVVLDLFRDGDQLLLCEDGVQLARTATLDYPLAKLLHRVLELACERQEHLAVFHAAGLASDQGALLLAGQGGSGKSTLAAALSQEGLYYLGDDLMPLLREPRELLPLPGCVCLKSGSWPVLARRYPGLAGQPDYQRAGQRVRYLLPPPSAYPARRPYPARLLVFPRYQPGVRLAVEALSSLEALERLAASDGLLPATDEPRQVGELLDWIEGLPAFSVAFGDLETAVAGILRLAREWL